ncbi:MAG TPA: bi-domain-containing oxidoreductase [Bryobacteraceae bacterium]|jgi:predicted dehydrogenase|nr:bi-domain-containing oxidoreductase [Bryobacteraceae bacterium]
MQQIVRKGIKDILVEEIPDPVATSHHVLIQPAFSLISSGTETASIHQEGVMKEVADNPSHIRKVLDVMKINGPTATIREVRAKFSEYAALGYSGAGILIEKHPTVTDLEIGARVAYGGEGTGHAETIVTGRNLVARVPEDVSLEHASFATLGAIAMNAVRIARLEIGDRVAVIGLGLVGQIVAQLARLQGAVVIATDLKPERVDLAQKLGAQHAISGGGALKEQVAAVTDGKGADCVIIAAASKSSGPCRAALEICRDRGRIVVLGAVDVAFPWNDMYLKEIQLYMSRAYGPGSYDPAYEKQGRDYPFSYIRWTENRNMEEFLRLIGSGQVQVGPLITHRFALQDGPQAYSTILDPASNSLAVLLQYPAQDPAAGLQFKPRRTVTLSTAQKREGKLGVALVGAGNLARWAHLPNLTKNPAVELRAVHSANGVRGKSYAARFGAAYCSTDYQQILDDSSIDLVFITSRNQYHATQALMALHAGKHVFVEKPMALTEQECSELVYAASHSGRQLTVGFNRRFAPFYKPLKAHLAKRTSPAVLHCRINSPGISGSYWMADPSTGGAILGEACHFVDLMYWLLDAEPVSVSAYSLPTGRQDPIGENNLVACFQFADGSIGNLTYCTVGSRTSGGERVEAYVQGLAVHTEDFKRLTIAGSIRRNQKKLFAEKGYGAQIDEFIRDLTAGKPASITVRDGARATIGCLRMLESARDGAPKSIDWDRALP